MENYNQIKSITGKVTFNGKGSINNDSSDQKFILRSLGLIKGQTNDNVTFHKKEFFKENGENKFKQKVSHDCMRHAMFNEEMPYYNGGLTTIPQVLFNAITSPSMIARGYMFTDKKTLSDYTIKKKGVFTISDALSKESFNTVITESCSCSGARGEKEIIEKTGKDGNIVTDTKGATSFFFRENVGENEYEATIGIDFTELQFISLDDMYGRKAADIDNKEFLELYLSCMKRNFATGEDVEKKAYYLKTSIMGEECAEEGVLLTQKMANKVVHTILGNIVNTKIERPSNGGFFNFKEMQLTINFADGSSKDITVTSNNDLDDKFFGYEQVYFEADDDKIRKRDAEIKRLKEEKKSKKSSK